MTFTTKQIQYAILAVVGLFATWYWNVRFMQESGGAFSVVDFVRGGYANSASTSLSNDLVVGTITFLVWSYSESRRLGIRHWWAFVVLTFGVAFACAFPLFLLVRDRRVEAQRVGPTPLSASRRGRAVRAQHLVLVAMCSAGVLACGGGKATTAEWDACVANANKSLDVYRQLLSTAVKKLGELPPAGTDPTAIANRKVLDDALAMVSTEVKAYEAKIGEIRAAVDAGSHSTTDMADGCANLQEAARTSGTKIGESGKAVQLYQSMTKPAP